MPTNRPASRRVGAAVLQTLLVLSLAWSALFLAWLSLARVDFGYPLLYELLDIPAHIEHYAPQNRYKSGFAATGKTERLAIFGQIARAIDRGGEGLADIRYTDASGRSQQFLRAPERIHLESVARLISGLRLFSHVMLAALVATAVLAWALRVRLPSARRVLSATALLLAVATVLVLAIGAERVFNTLHTWVFPPGEQWFFYYQESLMTTLMKAPDLFGGIAVLLLLAALGYFVVLLGAAWWLLNRRRGAS